LQPTALLHATPYAVGATELQDPLAIARDPAVAHLTKPCTVDFARAAGLNPEQALAALRDIDRPLYAVSRGRATVLTERAPLTLDGLAGVIPAVKIESFGSAFLPEAEGSVT